jgi:hypothetical protein
MNRLKSIWFTVGFLLLSNVSVEAQEVLFTIERSLNKDQIIYFLHLNEKGLPEDEDPIRLKWLDNENTGELIPVNWIKKKFGYGVEILTQKGEEVTFKFVSYDKTYFTLKKDPWGKYGVFARINDRMMKINHVYLKIDGGSFWKPNITEVAVRGFNELANLSVYETFNP